MKINVGVEIAEHLFTKDRDSFKAAVGKDLEGLTFDLSILALNEHDIRNGYLPSVTADYILIPEKTEEEDPVT